MERLYINSSGNKTTADLKMCFKLSSSDKTKNPVFNVHTWNIDGQMERQIGGWLDHR